MPARSAHTGDGASHAQERAGAAPAVQPAAAAAGPRAGDGTAAAPAPSARSPGGLPRESAADGPSPAALPMGGAGVAAASCLRHVPAPPAFSRRANHGAVGGIAGWLCATKTAAQVASQRTAASPPAVPLRSGAGHRRPRCDRRGRPAAAAALLAPARLQQSAPPAAAAAAPACLVGPSGGVHIIRLSSVN
eukprot:COSAG01_NODE_3314_length_6276_cov_280.140845_3_plen_191_part_00